MVFSTVASIRFSSPASSAFVFVFFITSTILSLAGSNALLNFAGSKGKEKIHVINYVKIKKIA